MLNDMINTLGFLKCRIDDDFVDRLHYYYTTTFLIIMALLVSFKMFAGKPLECWVPAEYKNSWEQYAEQYCWAQNTYYVPIKESIPKEVDSRNTYIAYYQWVPFFLLIEAGCFYFPSLIWRMFNNKSGFTMQKIAEAARTPDNIHSENRHKNIQSLALYLHSILARQYRFSNNRKSGLHKFMRCFNIRYYESYVSVLYIVVKIMYFVNVIGQLFFMNWFLQTEDYTFYGAGVLSDLVQGKPWENSGNFPRTTLCDLTIRRLANEHRYTVQCVLVLNIFTEKIFILLWLWFVVLAVLTCFNLIYWIISTFVARNRIGFLARQLEMADASYGFYDKGKLQTFARNFVKMDGVFVLRMLNLHAGLLFTADLVQALRELYDSWYASDEDGAEFTEHVPSGVDHPFEKLTTVDVADGANGGQRRTKAASLRRTESFLVPVAYEKYHEKAPVTSSMDFPTEPPKRRFFN